jgi:DNA-binding protein HU-beta
MATSAAESTMPTEKLLERTRTITRKQLAAQVAEKHGVTKAQSEAMLRSLVDLVNAHLEQGHDVRIDGLGVLKVRERPARRARNPRTGEAIEIEPRKSIAFRALRGGNRWWP